MGQDERNRIEFSLGCRMSVADIAKALGIRVDSVGQNLSTIFAKLGAANRAEATSIALRKQLLKI